MSAELHNAHVYAWFEAQRRAEQRRRIAAHYRYYAS